MKLSVAIEIAKSYAEKWGIICEEFSVKSKGRLWYCPIIASSFTLEFKTNLGKGVVTVIDTKRVIRFEYYPNNNDSNLLPLWAVFPFFTSTTSGWRQSYGEEYLCKWLDWYLKLTEEKTLQYQKRFPEPENEELNWTGYYKTIEEHNIRAH